MSFDILSIWDYQSEIYVKPSKASCHLGSNCPPERPHSNKTNHHQIANEESIRANFLALIVPLDFLSE